MPLLLSRTGPVVHSGGTTSADARPWDRAPSAPCTLTAVDQRPPASADAAALGMTVAFGEAVAIDGKKAVIGAVGRNDGQGAAYVFVRRGTTWAQRAELTAADGPPGDCFSSIYGVAISGNSVVVGAPGHNEWAGAAYIYTGLHRRG